MCKRVLFVVLCIVLASCEDEVDKCPQGYEIISQGVNLDQYAKIISEHNKFRQLIVQELTDEDFANVILKPMSVDADLIEKSKQITEQCEPEHVIENNPNTLWIGQNIYHECSAIDWKKPQWEKAVFAWFNQHNNYSSELPANCNETKSEDDDGNDPEGAILANYYAQLMWADDLLIGCDYIFYKDVSKDVTPYCKLYVCNYNPGKHAAKQGTLLRMIKETMEDQAKKMETVIKQT